MGRGVVRGNVVGNVVGNVGGKSRVDSSRGGTSVWWGHDWCGARCGAGWGSGGARGDRDLVARNTAPAYAWARAGRSCILRIDRDHDASLEVAVLPAPHPRLTRAPSSPVLGRRDFVFSRICRASSRTRTRRSSRATGGTRGASRCSRRASCRRATPTCACSRRRSSSRSTSRPVNDTRPPFFDIAPSGGSATSAHVAAGPRDMR